MNRNNALSYVTLCTRDFERQFRFYSEAFSLPVLKCHWDSDSQPNRSFAFFDLEGVTLALYPSEAMAHDAAREGIASGVGNLVLSHNVDQKYQVDQLLERLQAAGGTLTRAPQPTDWGGYNCYLCDPEGTLWEIVWSPSRQGSA